MSSAHPHQGHQGHPQESQQSGASSYTPTPVKKRRNVTGTHAAIDPQSLPQNASLGGYQSTQVESQIAPSVEAPVSSEAVEHKSEAPARPSSIQLNLDTFGVSNQEILEREQRTQAKLAEFEPLSAVPYQTPSPQQVSVAESWDQAAADPWASSTPEPAYASDPLDGGYRPNDEMRSDLYRGRRRAIRIIVLLVIVLVWALGMLVQVGVDRFIADPYGETMQLFSSGASDQPQIEVTPPETQVNIQKISAIARVGEVVALDKRVYVVSGQLSNQGSDSISAALLKVTLSHPMGADEAWEQSAEFNCCQDVNILGLDKRARRAFLKDLQAGKVKQEGAIRLSPRRSQQFSFVIELEESIPLKRGDTPRASVQVIFAE